MGFTAEQSRVFLTLAATSQAHLDADQLLVLRNKLASERDTAAALAATFRHLADETLNAFGLLDEAAPDLLDGTEEDRSEALELFAAYDDVRRDASHLHTLADRSDALDGPDRRELCRLLEAGERLSVALDRLTSRA
jgi:hypothetical protein